MLELGHIFGSDCQGLRRRSVLQIGGLGLIGLALDQFSGYRWCLGNESRPAAKAQACVLIYLAGGPSQFETFDPKPLAPARIRGPWGAIQTRLPGVQFGEMLPQLSQWADRISLVRSLNHANSLHQPWPILTGNPQHRISHLAAAHSLLGASGAAIPEFVNVGARLSIGAGALGAAHDPLEIADPLKAQDSLSRWILPADIPPERFGDRQLLWKSLDAFRRESEPTDAIGKHDRIRHRALTMLESHGVREAFDLTREAAKIRDRYGYNNFGQSCLLARRLIAAGTRLVQINWANREDGFAVGWDVHGDDQVGLVRMEQHLCPRFDQGLAAFLEDLDQRGMLASTLVVVTGEFGRTPQISRLGGRDHWPYCFSSLFAGGGVPPGCVVGASDKNGAYPLDRPISPPDFAATIFRLLGVDANHNDLLRNAVLEGRAISELCSR